MLQSMRSRRVGHDLVTEQQQASLFPTSLLSFLPSSHPYIRIPILQTVIHPSRYLPSSPSYPIYPSTLLSIYSPYNFLSIFLLIYSSIHPSIPRVFYHLFIHTNIDPLILPIINPLTQSLHLFMPLLTRPSKPFNHHPASMP